MSIMLYNPRNILILQRGKKMTNKFQEDEITEFKKATSERKEAVISIVSIKLNFRWKK